MAKFIPKEKLSRKLGKQLNVERRSTWPFSPVTKKVESNKHYNRKRKSHDRYDDYGMGFAFREKLPFKPLNHFPESPSDPHLAR